LTGRARTAMVASASLMRRAFGPSLAVLFMTAALSTSVSGSPHGPAPSRETAVRPSTTSRSELEHPSRGISREPSRGSAPSPTARLHATRPEVFQLRAELERDYPGGERQLVERAMEGAHRLTSAEGDPPAEGYPPFVSLDASDLRLLANAK